MTNRFKTTKEEDASGTPKAEKKVSLNITKTGRRIGKSARQTESEAGPNPQRVRLSADIEKGLHKKLKMYATLTERSIVEIIEEWLSERFTSELLESLAPTDYMRSSDILPHHS
jgi:hypothetical protein